MKRKIVVLFFVLFLYGCNGEIKVFLPPSNIASEIDLTYTATETKYIAITFDDGPNPVYTPQILDILAENDAKATFFILGLEINDKTGDIILKAYQEGHEIGNHTEDHLSFNDMNFETAKEQLLCTDEKIEEITGEAPLLVRPPFGAYSDDDPLDYNRPFILWNLDPEDWNTNDADYIVSHILENANGGDIIVLHDRFESTVNALEHFLPLLQAKGFEFVTVSTLIEIYEGEVQNKVYRHADLTG